MLIVAVEALIFVTVALWSQALKGLQCWQAHRDKTEVSNFYFNQLI